MFKLSVPSVLQVRDNRKTVPLGSSFKFRQLGYQLHFLFLPDREVLGCGDFREEVMWVRWNLSSHLVQCGCPQSFALMGYNNFLIGFWTYHILVHTSLLNRCFCWEEGSDFLFHHFADITPCTRIFKQMLKENWTFQVKALLWDSTQGVKKPSGMFYRFFWPI